MEKVIYKYLTRDENNNPHNRQKTVYMAIPTDEYGFISMTDLFREIQSRLLKDDTLISVEIYE
ncbi:MAG: hypothetical protein PHW77_02995 [Eubacteriales bacterium]|nr:hypothetical protein [Eubacteriales bacterium]